ncbi:hypothetical protein DSO57_1001839 [Entomophthora muscae]|uniref:Uncharacterized protein n=1 Tax=Entomophthora muscae TaxID=34485 RepID=A0ACC2SYM0_9FUNG|nr:hypothetical protein DSO57_1001839 [Entomophthora muscae]
MAASKTPIWGIGPGKFKLLPQTDTNLLLMTLTRRSHWKIAGSNTPQVTGEGSSSMAGPQLCLPLLNPLGYYLLDKLSSMMGRDAYLGHFGHCAMVTVPISWVITGLNLVALAHKVWNLFPLKWVPDIHRPGAQHQNSDDLFRMPILAIHLSDNNCLYELIGYHDACATEPE